MTMQTLAKYRALTPNQQRKVAPHALLVQGGPNEFASLDLMQARFDAEVKAAGGLEAWREKEKEHRAVA